MDYYVYILSVMCDMMIIYCYYYFYGLYEGKGHYQSLALLFIIISPLKPLTWDEKRKYICMFIV